MSKIKSLFITGEKDRLQLKKSRVAGEKVNVMLKPSVNELMKNVPSRYLLVNVTARRAREISEEAEKNGILLDEKPVKIAINEIASGNILSKMKSEYQLNY